MRLKFRPVPPSPVVRVVPPYAPLRLLEPDDRGVVKDSPPERLRAAGNEGVGTASVSGGRAPLNLEPDDAGVRAMYRAMHAAAVSYPCGTCGAAARTACGCTDGARLRCPDGNLDGPAA